MSKIVEAVTQKLYRVWHNLLPLQYWLCYQDCYFPIKLKDQLMKSSCYRKPKTAVTSKKNSNISSIIYKDITETLTRDYHQKINKRNSHKYRDSTTLLNDHSKNKSKDRTVIIKQEQVASRKNSKAFLNDMSENRKTVHSKNKKQQLKNRQVNNYVEQQNIHEQQESLISQSFSLLSIHNTNNKSVINTVTPKNCNGEEQKKTNKKNFDYKYIIGKGGFGKVWKVEHKKNRNQYAMKQMLKSLVMTKKSVQSVMNEKVLLSTLNSPFIVNMHYAFQDRDTLYLVLDLLEGGDLRHHLSTRNFNQIQAKFFISSIILGLEYLHNNKIIHRDIKPENLVLDSRGYIRITDLGIARIKKTNNSSDTSGTPGYMSPEVICRMNHSYVSDFFALGVICYQLATGRRPYNGYSRNQIREKMMAKQVQIRQNQLPTDWGYEAIDFINRLLMRKPEQRLGYNGIQQIKSHPWIRDINWKKLATKQIESPFIPFMKKTDFDQDEQITIQDEQQAELIEKNSLLLRKSQFQELFKLYYFEPSHRKTIRQSESIKYTRKYRQSKEGLENINPVSSGATVSSGVNKKILNSMSNSIKMKPSTKTTNSSTRRISGRRNDTTIRSSKQTILDTNETINIGHNTKQRNQQPQRPFFKY